MASISTNQIPIPEPDEDQSPYLQVQPVERDPFRFLDLPSEIRNRIYAFILISPRRINTITGIAKPAPSAHRIAVFLTSHQIHDEAAYIFYSTQTFRIFPIQDSSKLPTVRALAPRYRPYITTIELVLGSSWTAPPKSWTVNNGLGLQEMHTVRTLKIFIQCDPSHPAFEGFRVSRDYYTWFSGQLLNQILLKLPSLVQVEFDANPSVEQRGSLMSRLVLEVCQAKKKILWGPERGWGGTDLVDSLATLRLS
jgi:hypothetical protein